MAKKEFDSESQPKAEQHIEKYELTESIQGLGYSGIIDGEQLSIIPQVMGKTYNRLAQTVMGVVVPAKCIKGAFNPQTYRPDETPSYFENLTPMQVHQLVIAKVIALNEKQEEDYREWHRTFYKHKGAKLEKK